MRETGTIPEQYREGAAFNAEAKQKLLREINKAHDNPEMLSHTDLENLKKQMLELNDYQEYKSERINFETIDQILEEFDSKAAHQGQEITKTKETLSGLIHDVKKSITRYYDVVLKNEILHRKNEFREDPSEAEERDANRSRIHDALLSSLSALTRFCNKTIPDKFEGLTISKEKLFSPDDLADRREIGHWAYVTELGRRMDDLLMEIEKEQNKTHSVPS